MGNPVTSYEKVDALKAEVHKSLMRMGMLIQMIEQIERQLAELDHREAQLKVPDRVYVLRESGVE
jgi:hypothetical protein